MDIFIILTVLVLGFGIIIFLLLQNKPKEDFTLVRWLDNSTRMMSDLQKSLGEMNEVGRGIKSLQDYLASPKLRGGLGEEILSQMLSQVSDRSGFNNFLYLSKGEAKEIGRGRQYILGNTFEAFVGALYLDQGYKAAENFIYNNLISELRNIIEKKLWRDHKSLFQEAAQERAGTTPNYEVLEENGPDHARKFVVGVYLGKELVAQGEGSSKNEAQQQAAENALKLKGW